MILKFAHSLFSSQLRMKHEYSGMAQIPYKHLTKHNGLYLAHAMTPNSGCGGSGFSKLYGVADCLIQALPCISSERMNLDPYLLSLFFCSIFVCVHVLISQGGDKGRCLQQQGACWLRTQADPGQ
jgi:hypothetical protein